MNIQELDNYRLSDAVKFHDRLNPRLWDKSEHLRPEVKSKLLEIAADFQEFLGVPDLDVKDITVSGSNTAYNYTPSSDIDLHLVIDLPEADHSEVFRELFDAKKYQYNDMHNIKIGGFDVELYVQNPHQEHHSQGIYSLVNSEWISVPKRQRPEIDDVSVRSKAEDLAARIDDAVKSNNYQRIAELHKKIKTMRQAGLEQQGEYGSDNLAFKVLRNQGYIKKLIDARNAARDTELSLQERKKKKKKRVKYGFGGWFYPGYNFDAGETGGGDFGGGESVREASTPDGVSPSTKMFLSEKDNDTTILKDFILFVKNFLKLEKLPKIVVHKNPAWSESNKSFGRFEPESNTLHVSLANRHLLDVLRTTAHELAHCRQHELQDLPVDAGTTGSRFENQANAQAGVLMRQWAEQHPEQFKDLNESSGYIPTEQEKNDPRFVMALSPDVRPGATGKNANKMALKTDAQGRPALLIRDLKNALREFKETGVLDKPELSIKQLADKHKVSVEQIKRQLSKGVRVEKEHTSSDKVAREIALDHLAEFPDYYDRLESVETLKEEDLLEIRMSTANLRQLAAQTGAQAGMEFEMIVPNVEEELDPEYERDESYDRRARSFDDIEEFFNDGDYNSRGDIRRLMERLREDYKEWKMERTADEWADQGIDFMRDYIANNDLFDLEEAIDTARDEVIDANPNLPPESEEFQQLLRTRLAEMEEQFVEEEYEAQGRIYNDAFEEFAEEKNDDYDESDFLEETTPYMSDVESEHGLAWPYWYDLNADQSGEISVDSVADDFSEAIGRPVNASRSYHGGRREAGTYVVEPDGSLEADNPGDGGLEFVSPPLPIDEMLSDLNKVKKWAGDYGCYTNDSTGLHINISVPNYSLEKLDYVKLALLMGDEYVLDLFGRSGNHYAKAATGKIRDALRKDPNLAPQLMDKMRGHMEDLATKAIHSGRTDKYTSINTKTGYIEFRSPGGDWLDANFDKIENTLLRFTVALSAAIDPKAYRKEYLKKLYKLLEGAQDRGGVDVIDLFANYSAGELDKAALIRQVREKQLARGVAKGRVTGPTWWRVTNPANPSASIEVVASGEIEAINSAVLPGNYPEWARVRTTLRATPVRPYTAPTAQSKQGSWGIWLDGAERFVRIPRSEDGGDGQALRRFDSESAARTWLNNYRDRNPGVRSDISIREIPADYQWPPADAATSQTQTTAVPQGGNTGNWGVWVPALDRFASIPNAGTRRFETEADAQAWIQDYNTRHSGNDIGLVARQVAAAQPEFQEPNAARGDLTPRGPGPWEIYRISDNSSVRELSNTSRPEAEQEARNALGLRAEAPELYGVRTRQQQTQPTRTSTVPGQVQQTFTGEWDVLAGDEVVFRVQAETQGEANQKAREWILGRSREFLQQHQGQEISTRPRYAE